MRELQIGIHSWTISDAPDLKADDGSPLFGEADSIAKTIRLREGLSKRDRASTLIHESLHAAERALGIDLGEETVLKVEAMLAMLMHQNQDLFRSLLKDLR